MRAEKNKLEPSALIFLYEFDVSGTPWRIAEYDEDVTYMGQTYTAFPVQRDDITEDTSSQLGEFNISVANANRVVGGYLELYDGLIGSKVIITTVFAASLGESGAHLAEEFYVKQAVVNDRFAALTLAPKWDIMSFHLPGRTFEKNYCQWTYKGEGCYRLEAGGGYTAPNGFNDTPNCDHMLDGPSGCEFHANEKRYGGFFAIPKDRYILRI
jgi:lambda family phage minor tail protein L